MIKIDRDIRRLSDMGICVKNNIWVVHANTIKALEKYFENNTPPKLNLFERLYKWFKNKKEK